MQSVDTTSRSVASQVTAPPRGEDASSLIINPPAQGGTGGGTGVGTGGDNGSLVRRAAPPSEGPVPPRDRPSGNKGSGIERSAPPSGEPSRPVAPSEPVKSDPPPRVEAPKAEVVESESASEEAIREALGSAARQLSGDNSSAASLLDGGVQEQWGALMREGRISMSVDGAPDVRLHGARATAEFSASVNVRSPFGANRRRSARFTAELQRSGGGWRVVGLRPQGKLELK